MSSHERFAQLLMILEAQFGETMTPIEKPRKASETIPQNGAHEATEEEPETNLSEGEKEQAEADELDRLHALGIPFPGVEIKIDKHVARVWLEDLEVDCSYGVLRDRVRVVLERAVETVASMWTGGLDGRGDNLITANGHGDVKSKLFEKKLAILEA